MVWLQIYFMVNCAYYLQNSHLYIDLKIQGMDNIHAYKTGHVIAHPCPNFSSGLAKSPLRLAHYRVMEPTTVGSLWLENDLHENDLEFESHMGRSKKNVRVTSDGIHAEIHEIWTCVAPAAPPLFHAAVNSCFQGESPWNWSCNNVNLRKSTVTWMGRHYVFTVISRWSTISSTVNLCNLNCVIFSDTHCSFGPPIWWHSPFDCRKESYRKKSNGKKVTGKKVTGKKVTGKKVTVGK